LDSLGNGRYSNCAGSLISVYCIFSNLRLIRLGCSVLLVFLIRVINGYLLYWYLLLQCTQNTLSRIVLSNSPYRHLLADSRLAHLHWLPVDMRIKFKIATLTYKILSTGHHLLQPYIPLRSIRSASEQLLHIPPLRTNFSRRAFRHAAPTVWNDILLTI